MDNNSNDFAFAWLAITGFIFVVAIALFIGVFLGIVLTFVLSPWWLFLTFGCLVTLVTFLFLAGGFLTAIMGR